MPDDQINEPTHRLQGTLRCKAIPSSDWFLFKDLKTHLGLRDMRDVLILGLRWIHAGFYEPKMRAMITQLAHDLRQCDLEHWLPEDQPQHRILDAVIQIAPESFEPTGPKI